MNNRLAKTRHIVAPILLLVLTIPGCTPTSDGSYLFNIKERLAQPKHAKQHQLDSLLLSLSDEMIALPAPERELTGRRLLGVSRTYLKRLTFLGYAYQLTGDTRYAQKAEELLLKAATFEDWNPSHFLDVAEMTLAMAIGVDWCRNDLQSETIQATKQAIIEKGLKPSTEREWSWLTAEHNWNQVCNGGLAVGAMAVYDDAPELAKSIIQRSRKSIKIPEATYDPDGVYPEGSSYWNYGTSYHVVFLDAYSYFFPDSTLQVSDAFLNSRLFMLHVMGPTGFHNFSDNGGGRGLYMPLFWMADQMEDPQTLYYQMLEIDRLLRGEKQIDPTSAGDRLFPLLLLYLNAPLFERPIPMDNQSLSWSGGGDNPVSFHRSGWEPESTYVGIKAGSPGVNHGHMDVGSFVLDAKGQRWVLDLGMHNYHRLESQGVDLWNRSQNSQRWEIFRYNNRSHSTLVVDDQLQVVDGKVGLLETIDEDSLKSTAMDLLPMYPALEGVVRTITLQGASLVTVTDEVKNNDQRSVVRWAFPTRAAIGIQGSTATLSRDDQQITVEIISPQTSWRTYSAQPNNLFEDANPGVTMLGFEVGLAPDALEELMVEFRINKQEAL